MPRRAAQRRIAVSADHHRHVLGRHRAHARWGQSEGLPLELDVLAAVKQPDDRQHLVGADASGIETHVDEVELFLHPAGAQSEDDSPGSEQFSRCQLLGNVDGMSHR